MNIQSSSFSLGGHLGSDEGKYDDVDDGSISTLESDIKSLESIVKNDNDAELSEIKNNSEKKLSNLIAKDHEPPSKSSAAASAISRKSGCSKQNIMRHPSPKVLLISLCSISVLSIGLYLLLYFSIIPFDVPFESANIYNNFYSTTKQQKINHSAALHKLAMANLKDVSISRDVETDLPFFWLIPYTADISIIDIFGQCYHLSLASNYKEKIYLEDTVSESRIDVCF